MKLCGKCGRNKPKSAFSVRSDRSGGLQPHCRECRAAYYQNNKERMRSYYRAKLYGVTPEQYQELLLLQDYACAFCKKPHGDKPLCVDHDHDTGEIRFLLCRNCNTAIGLFGDDYEIIFEAARQLKLFKDVQKAGLRSLF